MDTRCRAGAGCCPPHIQILPTTARGWPALPSPGTVAVTLAVWVPPELLPQPRACRGRWHSARTLQAPACTPGASPPSRCCPVVALPCFTTPGPPTVTCWGTVLNQQNVEQGGGKHPCLSDRAPVLVGEVTSKVSSPAQPAWLRGWNAVPGTERSWFNSMCPCVHTCVSMCVHVCVMHVHVCAHRCVLGVGWVPSGHVCVCPHLRVHVCAHGCVLRVWCGYPVGKCGWGLCPEADAACQLR